MTDLKASVVAYLKAFEDRDLPKCMDAYAEDATIHFHVGVFQGRQAIEEWHKERFAADMRILEVSQTTVQDDTVIVDATVTSDRLRVWKISKLSGKATFLFDDQGDIQEVRLKARVYNPFEGW